MDRDRGIAPASESAKVPDNEVPFYVFQRIASVLTDRRLTSDERLVLIGLMVQVAGMPRGDLLSTGTTWFEGHLEYVCKAFGWSVDRMRLAWRSLEAKGHLRLEERENGDVNFHINTSAFP